MINKKHIAKQIVKLDAESAPVNSLIILQSNP